MKKKEKCLRCKEKILCVVLVVCVFITELLVTVPAEAKTWTYADTYKTIQATVESKTKIKLSWKKSLNGRLEIYRATANKGKPGKYKKIADISGKKKSYVDTVQYKKEYYYKIVLYHWANSSHKKKVKEHTFYTSQYTGMGFLLWEADTPEAEFVTGSSFITMRACVQLTEHERRLGFAPTGYKVYRRTENSDYKKLATVKSKKLTFAYTDKKVETGESYYYKVRAYRELNGQTLYSNYTDEIKLTADPTGSYKVELLTEEGEPEEIVIALTSAPDNMTTVLGCWGNYYYDWQEEKDWWKGDYVTYDVDLIGYSYDNIVWESDIKKLRVFEVKSGETIYLKFREDEDLRKGLTLRVTDVYASEIYGDIEYNGVEHILTMDLKKGTGTSRVSRDYD